MVVWRPPDAPACDRKKSISAMVAMRRWRCGHAGLLPRVYGRSTTYWSVSHLQRAARRRDPRPAPWRLVPNVQTMSGRCCAMLAAEALPLLPMLHESSLKPPKSTTQQFPRGRRASNGSNEKKRHGSGQIPSGRWIEIYDSAANSVPNLQTFSLTASTNVQRAAFA